MIVALFLVLILDMFIKIEYSSTKIEKILNNINQDITSSANGSDALTIRWKAVLNDNIININEVTHCFLSDRSISFLFTILNIFLLSIGFYLLNSFNSIKEKISGDLQSLEKEILNTKALQDKRQFEFRLYSLFNRLYSKYLSLKNSEKSVSSEKYNPELRYILNSELSEINRIIQQTKEKNIIINSSVYDFCFDIINEIKSKPNQNYQGDIPDDLIVQLNQTLIYLGIIINKDKNVLKIDVIGK